MGDNQRIDDPSAKDHLVRVGFSQSDHRASARHGVAAAHLVMTVSLALSLIIAAAVVTIGIARANAMAEPQGGAYPAVNGSTFSS